MAEPSDQLKTLGKCSFQGQNPYSSSTAWELRVLKGSSRQKLGSGKNMWATQAGIRVLFRAEVKVQTVWGWNDARPGDFVGYKLEPG